MDVLILSGSRNRQGQTARAISSLTKGANSAGVKSEVLFLPEMNLERCRQCDPDGWGICRREGRCIIEDDFAGIVEKINKADLVVFANPVYFGDLSECLRGFLDRLRRIRFSRPMRVPFPGAPPMPAGELKPAIGYCYAGGSGNGTATATANLERILQTCGFDVVDLILARRQNLEVKLPLLEAVGKWLATRPTSGPPPVPPPNR